MSLDFAQTTTNFKRAVLFILVMTMSLCGANALATTQLAQAVSIDSLAKHTRNKIARPLSIPSAPNLNAKSYILVDATSGKILAQKNADERLAPASLTKLMTLYVIAGQLKSKQIHMDDKVHVSRKAWKMPGSRMFIKVGTDIPVHELIKGIVIASGNDASVAMSEFISGSEDAFTDLMDQQAEILGMKNSHFTDATGMPHPNHYSTAHDMAILSRAFILDYPEFYKWFKEKSYTHNKITQHNRNRLLWRYKYADGLKTGHTNEAGYCLVSSAKKGNMRLISVVMGTPSNSARTEDSIRLFNYGFRFYETHNIYGKGAIISEPKIWMGKYDSVPIGVKEALTITIPRGQYSKLKAMVELVSPLKAPIKKGERYGTLQVKLDDDVLQATDLIAMQDIPKAGVWGRFTDYIGLSIHNFFSSEE